MLKFNVIRNQNGDIDYIETSLSGYDLLDAPKLNKGGAFPKEERELFKLNGLLPHQIENLEQQVTRTYAQFQEHVSFLSKNIYLNVLHDYNETLFYSLASQHLEEILPIIYTPTVGEAVENFSLELRKPRGLYLSYTDSAKMEQILLAAISKQTDLIVITDGEAVLGIGDQGIGGMKICHAKLMVYTLCGLNPYRTYPIQLDVGTNNLKLLNDPMYLGWRHERITGQQYDDFIHQFVSTLKKHFPHVYLHWEDMGRDNARRILTHYRDEICTINGDMQTTGTITLACVLAACAASNIKLTQQRVVIFGAGTAGVGIADQIVSAMCRIGLSEKEAYARFWLLDKNGLLVEGDKNLLPFQKPYARQTAEINSWNRNDITTSVGLLDVINHAKPTILIGASTVGNAFNEEIIKTMASLVEKPIIMPLSNPTSKSEAKPEDIIKWTEGRAIIATGSPFPAVVYKGRKIHIAQSNNAFAFPGIGLGAIAVKAERLTDNMLWAATKALSECSSIHHDKNAPLLPKLSEARSVSYKVARAVAAEARREGIASIGDELDIDHAIKLVSWDPKYYPYQKAKKK